MKIKWRMPHPATMFFMLTVAVIVASWICDIYGLSIRVPKSGEDIRVQNLLNSDGVRWMLQNVITNFTSFAPLGLAIIAMFGLGLAQHSGLLEACIHRCVKPRKFECQRVIIIVILLGLLSNIIGDAGYIILLPIAASLFSSVQLNPVAGIVTGYISVACGYSANLFVTILDPMLSIVTEKAALSSKNWEMGVGPMCNYFFMFVSFFLIGFIIYYVTCRYLLPEMDKTYIDKPVVKYKPLSNKERRACNLSLIFGAIYFIIVLLATFSPFGFLGGIDGGLLYSPFMMNILFIVSLGFAISGIIYGFASGRYKTDKDVINGLIAPLNLLSVYFVIAFFASQLYACFNYSHLDKYLAFNFASLLTSISAGKLPTLIMFIVLTACINLILTSATSKWSFMAIIFVPFFAQMGVSPDITQCAFRIGDSSTNAITPFLFYMPLVLSFIQQYKKKVTYATLFKYTWRYSFAIFICWTALFIVWYLLKIPFGI